MEPSDYSTEILPSFLYLLRKESYIAQVPLYNMGKIERKGKYLQRSYFLYHILVQPNYAGPLSSIINNVDPWCEVYVLMFSLQKCGSVVYVQYLNADVLYNVYVPQCGRVVYVPKCGRDVYVPQCGRVVYVCTSMRMFCICTSMRTC